MWIGVVGVKGWASVWVWCKESCTNIYSLVWWDAGERGGDVEGEGYVGFGTRNRGQIC